LKAGTISVFFEGHKRGAFWEKQGEGYQAWPDPGALPRRNEVAQGGGVGGNSRAEREKKKGGKLPGEVQGKKKEKV